MTEIESPDRSPGRRRVRRATSTLRIRQLRFTAADDIASLLQRAISYGVAPYVVPTSTTGTGAGATPRGADAGRLPRRRTGGTPGGFPGASGGGTGRGRSGRPGRRFPRDHHAGRPHDRRGRAGRNRHGRKYGRRRRHQEHHPANHRSENGQSHRPVRRAGGRVHPVGREQQQPADPRPGEDAGPAGGADRLARRGAGRPVRGQGRHAQEGGRDRHGDHAATALPRHERQRPAGHGPGRGDRHDRPRRGGHARRRARRRWGRPWRRRRRADVRHGPADPAGAQRAVQRRPADRPAHHRRWGHQQPHHRRRPQRRRHHPGRHRQAGVHAPERRPPAAAQRGLPPPQLDRRGRGQRRQQLPRQPPQRHPRRRRPHALPGPGAGSRRRARADHQQAAHQRHAADATTRSCASSPSWTPTRRRSSSRC